jgi:hypothetical protein
MLGLLSLFRQAVGAVCHKTVPTGSKPWLSVLSFNRLTNIFMASPHTPHNRCPSLHVFFMFLPFHVGSRVSAVVTRPINIPL